MNILKTLAFAALAAGVLAAPCQSEPQSMPQVQLTFAPVVKRVAPAVVNVYSRSVVQTAANPLLADPLFQRFFGATPELRQRVQQSLGSGVVVRSDGVIVTNNHVVQGGQNITVALSDRREFKARVLLADSRTDLAVIKIDTRGERLPTIEFADSDRLNVGDLVLAIGDPFGVGQTVTMGIVSALARTQIGASDYQFFIQTDAAINPGNSGGALVTADGKLAGINTAIYSRTGEYAGIGFATPANLVRRVVEGALGGGVKLPWFGADGQPVTAQIAQAMNLPRPGGVLIKSVYPASPAAQAGLKSGDVVLQIDGVDVDDMQGLNYRVATHRPGEVVHVRVAAAGGKAREISFALTLPPENPPRQLTAISGRNPLTGAHVENLSPAVASDLQLDFSARGVVVVSTSDNTPSGSYGFQPGDIIRSINGQEIRSVGELQRALEGAEGRWDMVVQRGNQRLSLSVSG
ncbi:MAG TPA: Do family serine endopeptidase [Rhizomicrobium sp.]|jgi:serine protease Do|nr:Do family serine endopeptidase [Rhizomicrobium sp.]